MEPEAMDAAAPPTTSCARKRRRLSEEDSSEAVARTQKEGWRLDSIILSAKGDAIALAKGILASPEAMCGLLRKACTIRPHVAEKVRPKLAENTTSDANSEPRLLNDNMGSSDLLLKQMALAGKPNGGPGSYLFCVKLEESPSGDKTLTNLDPSLQSREVQGAGLKEESTKLNLSSLTATSTGVPLVQSSTACYHHGCRQTAKSAESNYCTSHSERRRCTHEGCIHLARGANLLCVTHGGGKRCIHPGCGKSACGGPSQLCISHGGGKRCGIENCERAAEGTTSNCVRHGGGKRCVSPGCTKSAIGASLRCVACGGGRRCHTEGCTRSAVNGPGGVPGMCKAHGGGRRCQFAGCPKSAQGSTNHCIAHGGGKRCAETGCDSSAQSRGKGILCKRHFKLQSLGDARSATNSDDGSMV